MKPPQAELQQPVRGLGAEPYPRRWLMIAFAFFATVMLTTSYYNLVGEKDGPTALGRIFV